MKRERKKQYSEGKKRERKREREREREREESHNVKYRLKESNRLKLSQNQRDICYTSVHFSNVLNK